MSFNQALLQQMRDRAGGFQNGRRPGVAAMAPGNPVMAGHAPMKSMLGNLRLQQLYDLAYAFDIKVNMSGTKDQVLPILVAEESQGTFEKKPKRPFYFRRALWQPGDPPIEEEFPVTDPSDEQIKQAEEGLDAVRSWNLMRSLAKQRGINTHGMSKEEVMASLEKTGAA